MRLSPPVRMCLLGFILDLAVMIAITVVPFYVYRQLGGDARMSGHFGALQAVVYMVTCLVTSRYVSRSRNGLNWVRFGLVWFACLFTPVVFFRDAAVCVALGVVAWAGLAVIWPALYSWFGADPDAERRQKHLGWFNLSWSSGFAAGPLVAGPLYEYDYRLPFAVLAVLCAVSLGLALSMPHEQTHFGRRREEEEASEEETGHRRDAVRFLHAAWVAVILANWMVGVVRSVYPKRVEDLVQAGGLGLFTGDGASWPFSAPPATVFSWVSFACSAGTAALFFYLGRTKRWRYRASWLIVPQLAAAAGFMAMGVTHSLVVMLLGSLLTGMNLGVAFFAAVYYCVADPAHKHRRAAINEAAVGFGGMLGSFLFGTLSGWYGLVFPFVWFPVFYAPAFALQLWLLRPRRGG